jgi:hypothetical protein
MMGRHSIIVAMDGRSWVMRELYMAHANSTLHAVIKLAVGLAGAICSSNLKVGAVMGLIDHVTPRLNHGFGRLEILSVIVGWGWLLEGRGSLASKMDDEEASGESEDGDDSDDDADDGS